MTVNFDKIQLVRALKIKRIFPDSLVYLVESKRINYNCVKGISINNGECYINCFDEMINFINCGHQNNMCTCLGLNHSTRYFQETNNLLQLLAQVTNYHIEKELRFNKDEKKNVCIKEGEFFYDGISETVHDANIYYSISVNYAFHRIPKNKGDCCLVFTLEHICAYRDMLVLCCNDSNIALDPILRAAEELVKYDTCGTAETTSYKNMFSILKNIVANNEVLELLVKNPYYHLLEQIKSGGTEED